MINTVSYHGANYVTKFGELCVISKSYKFFDCPTLVLKFYAFLPLDMIMSCTTRLQFVMKTRMTIFIKTKFKISNDQTNIDMYRLAANITEYHIISKLILQLIIITNFCGPVSHLN